MLRGWTVRAVACAGVLTALLAGCTEKQSASTSLPPTTAAAVSPSLQPLGPPDFPVPAEARTKDAAGAEAALRYYLALITHEAAKSGQPLRDLSRSCSFCNFLANRSDEDAAAGYHHEGGEIVIESMAPVAVHDGIAEFTFSIHQAAVRILDSKGNLVAGRGQGEVTQLRTAAAMSWDESARAWFMTQLMSQQ